MASALDSLIDPAAPLSLPRARGTSSPRARSGCPRESSLYFSDIPGDTRWRWSEGRGMEIAARPTFKGNGMALDNDGNLLVCEQVSSCLVRLRAAADATSSRSTTAAST